MNSKELVTFVANMFCGGRIEGAFCNIGISDYEEERIHEFLKQNLSSKQQCDLVEKYNQKWDERHPHCSVRDRKQRLEHLIGCASGCVWMDILIDALYEVLTQEE